MKLGLVLESAYTRDTSVMDYTVLVSVVCLNYKRLWNFTHPRIFGHDGAI